MKVGYVLKRYPRFSETFVVSEILAHEAVGTEVEIFALRPPSDTHFQAEISRVRAPVTYLPSRGVKAEDLWSALEGAAKLAPGAWSKLDAAAGEEHLDVYQAALLAREARLRGVTHLHAHFATAATSVARLASRLSGIPYTFTAHAKDVFHESVRPEDLRRKLAGAAGVVTVSDYNANYLREEHGAAKVRRIYNGLDLLRFPYRRPVNRLPRVAAVGRLVEKKGFADLIEACAVLARSGSPVRCEIAGAGELKGELGRAIETSGAPVRLLGPLPRNEVVRLVRGAAALVAPCVVGGDGNRDGLPTVLLEAMALGTPVVSTDVTGVPEVVRDGLTGLLVAQRDPDALAGAISRLAYNSALRVRISDRARERIEADFDISKNTARLREVFAGGLREGIPA